MHGSDVQGRVSRNIRNIAVRTAVDQETDNIFALRIHRTVQRGPFVARLRIDENPAVDQRLDTLEIAGIRRSVKIIHVIRER
jgi:hypothetical protein